MIPIGERVNALLATWVGDRGRSAKEEVYTGAHRPVPRHAPCSCGTYITSGTKMVAGHPLHTVGLWPGRRRLADVEARFSCLL